MATARDYSELDAAIMARLPTNFNVLQSALKSMADKFAKADGRGDVPGWRVIDRRLQAMRKKGHIKFVKGLWHRASPVGA